MEHAGLARREDVASLRINAQGRGREIGEASELGGGQCFSVAADEGQGHECGNDSRDRGHRDGEQDGRGEDPQPLHDGSAE